MLNINKVSLTVLTDLEERGHSFESINKMSATEAFDEWCNWNGLIHWGPKIRQVYEELKKAEI